MPTSTVWRRPGCRRRARAPRATAEAAAARETAVDVTVPIGTSRIAAISLYENPSTSASTTTIRKSSGRRSIALQDRLLADAIQDRRLDVGRRDPVSARRAVDRELLQLVQRRGLGPPRDAPKAADPDVAHDPQQPGPDVGAGLVAREVEERPLQGVLEQILGRLLLLGHPKRRPEEHVQMRRHFGGERVAGGRSGASGNRHAPPARRPRTHSVRAGHRHHRERPPPFEPRERHEPIVGSGLLAGLVAVPDGVQVRERAERRQRHQRDPDRVGIEEG